MSVTIVDYGLGNLRSLCKMFERLDVPTVVTADPEAVLKASRLVLPGVGNFRHGAAELHARGLTEALRQRVLVGGVPALGICLGMQLFGRASEEGEGRGLAWFDAVARRLPADRMKVPNMGWHVLDFRRSSRFFPEMERPWRFYFVHGYHLDMATEPADAVVATVCGDLAVTAVVERDNLLGVQFHPEKSHSFGFRLLATFARA